MGAAKVARDITERKQAEETQRLLMGELNHRVKNSLATVQAIASQTLRRTTSPAEFVPAFQGRIQALASAHSLLTASNWQGAELRSLIQSQVCAGMPRHERIHCAGPELVLPPQMALHLALVLHELGTNARKHGALSSSDGKVDIRWSVRSRPSPTLDLQWAEHGGPPIYVAQPRREGFGTILVEHSIRAMDGGEARMDFDAQGVRWELHLPLPNDSVSLSVVRTDRQKGIQELLQPARGSQQRVLVIEDEPLVGLDMQGILKDGGYDVIGPVLTLEEALACAASKEFDAVLLDANLGGNRVDEVAAVLTRRGVPFAFVTGYGRESLPASFSSALLIAKPFEPASLLGVTHRLLTGTDSMRLHRSSH